MSGTLPRTAIVSPLPPARSGVADYSARIVKELARLGPVELLGPAEASKAQSFDKVIYQIGNNGLHAPIYRAALAHPGIIEIHDAVLNHLLLGMLTHSEYVDEFVYNEGEWNRSLGEGLWDARGGSASDERFFRYTMLRRIVERSEGVIVHNPSARKRAESILASVFAWNVPHFVDSEVSNDGIEARERLGIPAEAFVISCFGYQRPTKRLGAVLDVCSRLEGDQRLLVVGDFVDEEYERSLGARLSSFHVVRKPFVSDSEFQEFVSATDVCVNLRFPSAGETSGIAMKLLAAGKPVIVTDGDEYADFPPGTVIRVDPGEVETAMLFEYLAWLQSEPEARRAIGRRSKEYVTETHSIDVVIKHYCRILEHSPPAP